MKPTAPPVKRGSPGTNGDWKLRHQPPQRRHERPRRSRSSSPERSMRGPAVARPQHEERILAEEGVARDLLAAFDALEEERVVGVLGDLEERRHRRQQVRDDLLDDRHERAAPRQLDELFERGLLHSRCSWRVALLRPNDRARPLRRWRSPRPRTVLPEAAARPQLELPFRLRDQHLDAADRLAAGRAARCAAARSRLARRPGRRPSRRRAARRPSACLASARCRRGGVHQHIPARRLRRELAGRCHPRGWRWPRRRVALRAQIVTLRPAAGERDRHRARRAAGAEDRDARAFESRCAARAARESLRRRCSRRSIARRGRRAC